MVKENIRGIIAPNGLSHKSPRKEWGIPEELDGHRVLYLTSRRDVCDSNYPSHVESFLRTMAGGEVEDVDKISAFLDLNTASQDKVISTLKSIFVRDDPSGRGKHFQPNPGQSEPPLGFSVNVYYLPPLDSRGYSTGPYETFSMDLGNLDNVRYMLGELKKFLEEKGVLYQAS